MGELRRDPISGRWIIIAPEREKSPAEFMVEPRIKKGGLCPFCPGSEDKTPPEITAHREDNTKPNTPGWKIRVIPNKFPALRVEGEIDRIGVGVYDLMNGVGAHEVIIETPDHNKQMADFSELELEKVLHAYCQRSLDLLRDIRFKYILIFKNYGEPAGASLEHSHSQIIALPIVPKRVNEELIGSSNYFEYKERCVFCDMVRQELEDGVRIIAENKSFLAFSPFASCFPYESWVLSKEHSAFFCRMEHEDIADLARILKETLARLKKLLMDPSYNFIIHTSPAENHNEEEYHWHIEIMPKLTRTAGFEWGSGFYINPILPEHAAKFLRGVKL
ncbi:MAG: galactose-1-phosphate uridylyltransferase [Candidatus Omnitrophica bacterium]|nr:galactose-1-phosphate uridylyltransferase [Candidatus Omnitrophota bacterium]